VYADRTPVVVSYRVNTLYVDSVETVAELYIPNVMISLPIKIEYVGIGGTTTLECSVPVIVGMSGHLSQRHQRDGHDGQRQPVGDREERERGGHG